MPCVLLQNLTSTFFFSPLFPFSLSHSLPFPSLGDSHSDKALRLQPGQCYGEFAVEVRGLWKSQQLAWRAALCLLSNWGWVWAWGNIWVHQRRSWERVRDKWSCSLEKGYMVRTHSLNEVGSADKRVPPCNGTSLAGRGAWFPSHLWVSLDSPFLPLCAMRLAMRTGSVHGYTLATTVPGKE